MRARRGGRGERRRWSADSLPPGEKKTTRRQTEERSPRWPQEAEQGTPPRFWRSVAQSGITKVRLVQSHLLERPCRYFH
ncbi:hypothetical protein NDU88_007305 [Pleurodeles waltl]|uniref:Uncharacterized protein n=1 Tax=Pleurodeles waltl TaxID=8319 RepID=A0AAV7UNG0_PLEWA|nr:hypothetical protein NDU88_007305 [Pleurodeles waltl]